MSVYFLHTSPRSKGVKISFVSKTNRTLAVTFDDDWPNLIHTLLRNRTEVSQPSGLQLAKGRTSRVWVREAGSGVLVFVLSWKANGIDVLTNRAGHLPVASSTALLCTDKHAIGLMCFTLLLLCSVLCCRRSFTKKLGMF